MYPVILDDKQVKYPLGLNLEYLEDPKGRLTIDDVISTEYEMRFVPGKTDVPTIGFTDSAYWVRVRFQNAGHIPTDWRLVLQQPYLDLVDLWLPDANGQFQVKQAGDQRPFDIREVEHRKTVFKVSIESELTLYLRIQSTGFMVFDLILWTADAFQVHNSRHELFLGFFLGILCIMAAYNLFLFMALGDRAYLHYVLFLVGGILHFATLEYGLSYQYLWPNQILFNHIVTLLFPLFSMVFALNFAMSFLQTKTYAPMLHRCLIGLRLPFLLLPILAVLQEFNRLQLILAVLAIPTIVIIMVAGIQAWRRGYQPARYYTLAWSMLWLNVIALAVHVLKLMTISENLQIAPFTVIGSTLFLSLALADRIDLLKRKTEQAKVETDEINLQLAEHQKRLARSEKKYRTLFEESNDMIFMTDLDGRIEDVSPSCEALLGYTRTEALQLNVLEAYADPADRARLQSFMLEYRAIRDFEVALRHKDGRKINTLMTATLRYTEDTKVVGFQGIARDITAHKQAEAERLRALELQTAKELAEAANRAKSTFLANMSHELRTPMNSILGFAKVLTRSLTLSSEDRCHLGLIMRNGEHLLTLINQVLDLSKIEAGRITLNNNDVDLFRLLNDMEDLFSMKANQKGLHLILECAGNVPHYVRTDEVKLRQVLMNILGNAVKFTNNGSVTLRISLKSHEHTKSLHVEYNIRFEIEDTGPGIASEDMDKVFEAFGQTLTGRQSQEGTGLGLPISRRFVQLMGGDIHVKSEGRGTIFMFDIQTQKVDAADINLSPLVRRVIALEPGQPRYRMLIVDDNHDNRQLLLELLKPFDFDLREAENGQEAIDIRETWKPHLIWMDFRMPVMDGYEATRRIKIEELRMQREKKSDHLETIIIVVTASSFEEERSVVLSCGCDDFLRKPFTDAEIFKMLHKHLGLRFVYEEEQKKEGIILNGLERRQTSKMKNVLISEALEELPASFLETLEKGARRADFLLLTSMIEQIRKHDVMLADALEQLTENFEYDEILTLIQKTVEGEKV